MAVKDFEKLSIDYLELLDDKEDFNVIINAGESPNTKIFRVHSNVLRYRSLYFRDKLANTNKDTNNIKTINLSHVTIQQFEIIIRYIYGGVILLEDQDASFLFNLMLIASEFLLEELIKHIEIHLIETKANWLCLDIVRIYQKSIQNHFQTLQKWCNDFLVKYPNMVFDSEDFNTLQENALVSLIKRDDLQMEEVKIWNYIIQWGITQNPDLLSIGPENWTSENFRALKNTLKNCLPHIRYFQISGDDIVDHIEPYQAILERNLWKDIIKRVANPNRQISSIVLPLRVILAHKIPTSMMESFSTVITENHAAKIVTWIDKNAGTHSALINLFPTFNPYKFKLLLRGSRDGFTRESFWKICDKQANTIVVMKVKNSDEILGGYNPIKWDKSINNYVDCNDSFIFSFKNGNGIIISSILSRVNNPQYSIRCHRNYGPFFGDLLMSDNFNQDNGCEYEHYAYKKVITTPGCFSVTEYEIFQIQNK